MCLVLGIRICADTGCDNGNHAGVCLGLVIFGTENDIDIVAGLLTDICSSVIRVEQRNVAGHIQDNISSTVD